MNIAKLFILTVFGFSCTRSFEWNEPIDYSRAEIIAKMIFPNMTQIYNQNSRRLPYNPKPVKQVPCIICQNLKVCSALNKLLIEEKYYPNNLNLLGTCWIIEDLAKRVQKEVFGNGRTFRDTPLCRDIVMQYLCLFWGSDNQMYKNLCAWQEDVSSPNPADHIIAPKPPCRSFCVQVADICANDPDFIKLCNNIQCPPTEDECSPDPKVNGQVIASGIGCQMPYSQTPYNASYPLFNKFQLFLTTICIFFLYYIFLIDNLKN